MAQATFAMTFENLEGGKRMPATVTKMTPRGQAKQRLNLVLPISFYTELRSFSDEMGRSLSDSIRWMFGIAKLIWDELQAGHKIIVVGEDDEPVKEICFPR